MHKPLYVEAVQVTSQNMVEVAEWCGGTVQTSEEKRPRKYILVATVRPMQERQTWAFAGNWVLKTPQGYKIYTNNSFMNGFIKVVEENIEFKMERILDRAGGA